MIVESKMTSKIFSSLLIHGNCPPDLGQAMYIIYKGGLPRLRRQPSPKAETKGQETSIATIQGYPSIKAYDTLTMSVI